MCGNQKNSMSKKTTSAAVVDTELRLNSNSYVITKAARVTPNFPPVKPITSTVNTMTRSVHQVTPTVNTVTRAPQPIYSHVQLQAVTAAPMVNNVMRAPQPVYSAGQLQAATTTSTTNNVMRHPHLIYCACHGQLQATAATLTPNNGMQAPQLIFSQVGTQMIQGESSAVQHALMIPAQNTSNQMPNRPKTAVSSVARASLSTCQTAQHHSTMTIAITGQNQAQQHWEAVEASTYQLSVNHNVVKEFSESCVQHALLATSIIPSESHVKQQRATEVIQHVIEKFIVSVYQAVQVEMHNLRVKLYQFEQLADMQGQVFPQADLKDSYVGNKRSMRAPS
ncbi:hypothetical protein R1sor_004969 [Riccia sorocarpa]|uniref:Uncharacterized protein n=1 Tax=Riccia sorocarpa TaxID=122646 RepID=A0ABD3HIS1_9MARC